MNVYLASGSRRAINLRTALLVGVAVATMPLAAPAFAQDAQQGASEGGNTSGDIVVTAQRREQNINKVPISITAVSGEDLSRQGISDARGIASQTPGLVFDGGASQGLNAFVTIRGVAQVDYSEHQEMPNAVYLDEVYVPTTSMVAVPVYDMQRAEALRGPQGTLFGRNSTGGLVQFITRDPGKELNGFGELRYGSYNRVWAEGAIGGPISENIGVRLAGYYQSGDGYFKNHNTTPGDNANGFEQKAWGLRGKIKLTAGDWTATLTGSLNHSPRHVEGVYKALPSYFDPATGQNSILPPNVDAYGTGPGNDPRGYRDPSTDGHEGSFNSKNSWLSKRFDYATLKIQGPISDGITLSSITSYTIGKIDYSEDSDSTPFEVFNFRAFGTTKQISEELRLNGDSDKVNWTLGAYFLDLRGTYGTDFDFVIANTLYPNRYSQQTQSFAVFGQLEYKITDRLSTTIGARYTHDKKHFESVNQEIYPGCAEVYGEPTCQNYNFTDAGLSGTPLEGLNRQSHGDFAGKVALNFQATPDLLVYASISRGIRGGGFNATADGYLPITKTPFKNESVMAYEVGLKADLFNGLANVRTSVFYYDYKNLQTFNYNGIASSVSNNNARFYGGEAELSSRPWKGAKLGLGLALLNAKVFNVNLGSGPVNLEPVKAPGVTFNGSFAQTIDLGDFQLNASADVNYIGKHKANLADSNITNIPGSWITNARIGIGQTQNGWELYGFVHNLFDVDRKTFGYDNTFNPVDLALLSYAEPRMFGVGVRKDF